ncbi:MAG TPA: AI-2E family transporter [Kofleriaceae bacterium]|jgi:predicted PurR-regulated permease PerM|nr:AI-2E family transporter [Kofleriaceae bacterium]
MSPTDTPPPESGPTRMRTRDTWFGNAPATVWTFLGRWAFPLFVLLIAIIGHAVLLPFVFAGLIAYILSPIVRAMAERPNGTRRMPRGLAVVICYIVFIAGVVGFMFLLVPRLSRDVARLGKEAPGVYKRINEEYTPELARWLEERFPSLKPVHQAPEELPIVPDVPLPPGTAFTLTPLPDGRFAMQLAPHGVDVKTVADGYHIQAVDERPEPLTLEDKLRAYVKHGIVGLQGKLNDVARVLQDVITGFVRGIFMFFFTLMIAAFILIDMEKLHAFMRGLFPTNTRDDYDIIVDGIDRGLSGVIRGQLLICVINASMTYVGLLTFGVKYQLILAIVAGMMSLIPIFGSIMSSVPIVIVALVSGNEGVDILRGVIMVLWITGIHLIEANVLNPKIIGTAAKIHPVLVIFALFFGEASYGLVGALLAVPILSAISVIFMYFYRKRWKESPRTTGPIPPVDTAAAPAPTRS